MRRALTVGVAVLLLLASAPGGAIDAPIGAKQADDPAEVASGSSEHYMTGSQATRRLELTGENRSTQVGSSWNLGARIYASDAALSTSYEAIKFEARLEAAPPDDREQLLTDRLQELTDSVGQLRDSERAAVAAYVAGDVGVDRVKRTLARSYVRGKAIRSSLRAIEDTTDRESTRLFAERLREDRLDTFVTPVRARLVDSLRGDSDVRVSLRVAEVGYVLGVVEDGRYLREAMRYDNRRPEGPKAITSPDDVLQRQNAVYNITNWSQSRTDYSASGAYLGRSLYELSDREIEGFFDAGTGDVFFEQNRYRIDSMAHTTAINETNGSVRLRVERTFYNGPIRVIVTDAETGEPIDTAVRIGGERVGTTGADGVLRLVEPSISYAVTVEVDGTTVSDSVIFS